MNNESANLTNTSGLNASLSAYHSLVLATGCAEKSSDEVMRGGWLSHEDHFSWLPFLVWLAALVCLTLATALLVYCFLRTGHMSREGYGEIDGAAAPAPLAAGNTYGAAGVEVNRSRKNFLESRRLDAQLLYGTGNAAALEL